MTRYFCDRCGGEIAKARERLSLRHLMAGQERESDLSMPVHREFCTPCLAIVQQRVIDALVETVTA